ncbi:unnamed protein product [Brassica oleracea var. botrytis]
MRTLRWPSGSTEAGFSHTSPRGRGFDPQRHSKGRGRTETVKNPCPTSGGLRPVLNAGFGDFLQGGPFGGGDSV